VRQKVTASTDLVGGEVDEGYGKVADAFRRNLGSGQEDSPTRTPALDTRM